MYYVLTDGPLLKRLMKRPDTGGTRHTVRSLAAATGISKSKISSMLNDRQTRVTAHQANLTAEAVGVRRKAIFMPQTSTSTDIDKEEVPCP